MIHHIRRISHLFGIQEEFTRFWFAVVGGEYAQSAVLPLSSMARGFRRGAVIDATLAIAGDIEMVHRFVTELLGPDDDTASDASLNGALGARLESNTRWYSR